MEKEKTTWRKKLTKMKSNFTQGMMSQKMTMMISRRRIVGIVELGQVADEVVPPLRVHFEFDAGSQSTMECRPIVLIRPHFSTQVMTTLITGC
jgi:hypothetical protein